jgi:hypothetical protein
LLYKVLVMFKIFCHCNLIRNVKNIIKKVRFIVKNVKNNNIVRSTVYIQETISGYNILHCDDYNYTEF